MTTLHFQFIGAAAFLFILGLILMAVGTVTGNPPPATIFGIKTTIWFGVALVGLVVSTLLTALVETIS